MLRLTTGANDSPGRPANGHCQFGGPNCAEKSEAVVVPEVVARNEGIGRRLARYEATLGLIAQHRDKLGAIVGLGAQRLVRDDDRGSRQCGRPDAIDHILRDGDAVERILGVVRVVDRDCGPAQAGVLARHRGEYMRADPLLGIADRDRDLDAEIEHFAPVRPRFVRVAPHVKLLRGAADVDRDRHEREFRIERRLGGGGFPGLGRLDGLLCSGGIGLRFRVGRCGVELLPSFLDPGSGLLPPLLGPLLRLVRFCGRERLVGGREFGIGAGLERCQLAQRRRERRCLARRGRGSFLRLGRRPWRLPRPRGRASRPAPAQPRWPPRFGTRSAGWEKSTGAGSSGAMITRIPIRVLLNSLSAKPKGIRTQPCEAAYPGNGPPCSAMPFQVMRCMCGIQASSYMFERWSTSLIDDGEDAGRRLAFLDAGRYRRAQDPAVRVVENDLLGLDRYDRHDRLTRLARRRRLFGLRGARLPAAASAVSAVSAAIAASVTMAAGPQRRIATVDCAVVNRFTMPWPGWNACPRLRRSSVKSRCLDNQQPTPYAANSFLGTIARSVGNSFIYDSGYEGWLAAEIGTNRTSPNALHMSQFFVMATE